MAPPQAHWWPSPSEVERSEMAALRGYCEAESGLHFADYHALHEYACREPEAFWTQLLRFTRVPYEGSAEPAIERPDSVEHARFFPNVRLNYAEAVLAGGADDAIAITARSEEGVTARLTYCELRQRVGETAADLRTLGVELGDRVVAVCRNQAEAMIAGLAAASLGAPWSSVAPDLALDAIVQRFAPLEPKVLVANTTYRYQGVEHDITGKLAELVRALPTLRAVLTLDTCVELDPDLEVFVGKASLCAGPPLGPIAPVRVPFDHPLFILFSSGTTGPPKCIVHGHGGTALEHIKELRFHAGLRPVDKLYYHTSCAWMMWNWMLSGLSCGAEVLVYDGSVSYPNTDSLLQLVEEEGVTHFGTSATYLQYCRDARVPARSLPRLRCVMSTGSILFDPQFDWVTEHLGPVPIHSISGGTDIVGCFVLGNPTLPVYRGESQCISLGYDVRVLAGNGDDDGPARLGTGELVCVGPFPSRPVGLYGDSDGSAFHAAYFAENPGVWTHGDFVELTDRGSARMLGRSDGVMNIQGIRIGPAEIYHVLQEVAEVASALCIAQNDAREIGGNRLVLLVVLQDGAELDRPLTHRIKRLIKQRASMAHVPKVIAHVRSLPTTHSGKLSERAATDAANGRDVRNAAALRNPESIRELREHPALRV